MQKIINKLKGISFSKRMQFITAIILTISLIIIAVSKF